MGSIVEIARVRAALGGLSSPATRRSAPKALRYSWSAMRCSDYHPAPPWVCPAPGNGLAMAMPCETVCTVNTRPSSPRCVGASEAGQGVRKANAHGYAGLIELDEACQRHRVFQVPHREGKLWRQRRVLRVAHRAVSSEPGASQPASHCGPRRPRGPPWIPARSGPLRCGPGAARCRSLRARFPLPAQRAKHHPATGNAQQAHARCTVALGQPGIEGLKQRWRLRRGRRRHGVALCQPSGPRPRPR